MAGSAPLPAHLVYLHCHPIGESHSVRTMAMIRGFVCSELLNDIMVYCQVENAEERRAKAIVNCLKAAQRFRNSYVCKQSANYLFRSTLIGYTIVHNSLLYFLTIGRHLVDRTSRSLPVCLTEPQIKAQHENWLS